MQANSNFLPFILLAWALPVHSMQVSGSLELSWRDYDSSETAPGGFVFNHEQGDLPGIALTLAADGPVGGWALHVAHEGGDLVYRGLSQFAVPVFTTTLLAVDRAALRWAPAWEPALGPVTLRPHLELMHQRINRAIQPSVQSTALTEKLDSTFIHAGLSARLPISNRWSLQADGQVSRSLRQRLKVDTFGFYDKFVLRPSARTAGRVGVGVVWQPAPDFRTAIWVARERWHFGSSPSRDISRDGVAVGSANYPGSRQHLVGVSLRIEHLF